MHQFHIAGLVLTALIHGGVIALVFGLSGVGGDDSSEPALVMTTIEASLAYKTKAPAKQPQKQRRLPPPPVKPTGVSRDESKQVEPDKKPPEPPPKPEQPEEDYQKLFEKFKEQRQAADEEADIGEPLPEQSGAFDGSQHGYAHVNKGDPYFQELAGQVHASWSVPTLERGTGAAVGCVQLAANGRVVDTKLWQTSENANIDRSVQLALKNVQELRNEQTRPVPSHIIKNATERWICFNLAVDNTP